MTSREVREECGLEVPPADLKKIGMIDFEFKDDPVILEVHVFTAVNYKGHPVETEGKQNSGHSSIFFYFFFFHLFLNQFRNVAKVVPHPRNSFSGHVG